jgi:hypothetical protein
MQNFICLVIDKNLFGFSYTKNLTTHYGSHPANLLKLKRPGFFRVLFILRSRTDSNRRKRFCRPLPSHSATRPYNMRANLSKIGNFQPSNLLFDNNGYIIHISVDRRSQFYHFYSNFFALRKFNFKHFHNSPTCMFNQF